MEHKDLFDVIDKPQFFLEIFLQPGELYFGEGDTRIRTILGSCVAITLWHPRLKIGGMCHYMLPGNRRKDRGERLDGRYADEAMLLFLRELIANNTRPAEYEVKMFGGGDQFPNRGQTSSGQVPSNNILIGRQLLKQHGFNIKAEHMGGTGHRNIIFDLWSGSVWMRHVAKTLDK